MLFQNNHCLFFEEDKKKSHHYHHHHHYHFQMSTPRFSLDYNETNPFLQVITHTPRHHFVDQDFSIQFPPSVIYIPITLFSFYDLLIFRIFFSNGGFRFALSLEKETITVNFTIILMKSEERYSMEIESENEIEGITQKREKKEIKVKEQELEKKIRKELKKIEEKIVKKENKRKIKK